LRKPHDGIKYREDISDMSIKKAGAGLGQKNSGIYTIALILP
jgi:hypothetical protein